MKLRHAIFRDDVYRKELLFYVGGTYKEFQKDVAKRGFPPPGELAADGLTARFTEAEFPKIVRGTIFIMWISNKKDFYCLLHEVAHLSVMVFGEIGMSIRDDDSSEAFAYYQEYWFKNLWRFMSKNGSR